MRKLLWSGQDRQYVCVFPPVRWSVGDLHIGFAQAVAVQQYEGRSASVLIAPTGRAMVALRELDEELAQLCAETAALKGMAYEPMLRGKEGTTLPLSCNVSVRETDSAIYRLLSWQDGDPKKSLHGAQPTGVLDIERGTGLSMEVVVHKLRVTPDGTLQPRLHAEQVVVDVEAQVRQRFAPRQKAAPPTTTGSFASIEF